jgi:Domain of unknown function (DUF5011)
MNNMIKIISLLTLGLFALCTQVKFDNPLDPQAANYDFNKAKDEDGDGVINGKDPDWKNYVKDLVPPEFSMNGGDVVEVDRSTEDVQKKYNEFKSQVKATDAKDGDVTNRITVNPEEVSTLIDESYDVIFIVTDIDNNADTIHRTFKVYTPAAVDKDGPRINFSKDTIEFYVGDTYREPIVTAYDIVDGDVSSSITKIGTVDIEKEGLYPVEYTAKDKSGNPSKRTLYVKVLPGTSVDNIVPVITLTRGKDTIKLNNGDKWVDPGYSASDNKDGDITSKVAVDTTSFNSDRTDILCKVTYHVKDNAGNPATEYRYVQFGKIVQDVPPSFYLEGKLVTKETAYSINLKSKTKTVTAKDKDGLDISSSIKRTGTFDSTTIGSYALTYSVKDKDFVEATLKVTITVIDANKDTTKPVITIKGRNPDTVSIDSVAIYKDSGATAYDLVNGIKKNLTVTPSGNVDRKVLGTYKITYSAVDSAGNPAEAVRTVVVREISNNLLVRFGVPSANPLPTVDNGKFTSSEVLGSGGPVLTSVSWLVFNWNLQQKSVYSFALQHDGAPYYEEIKATQTFGSASPKLTLSGLSITALNGEYYVTMDGKNFVWVKTDGSFAIIWKP